MLTILLIVAVIMFPLVAALTTRYIHAKIVKIRREWFSRGWESGVEHGRTTCYAIELLDTTEHPKQ